MKLGKSRAFRFFLCGYILALSSIMLILFPSLPILLFLEKFMPFSTAFWFSALIVFPLLAGCVAAFVLWVFLRGVLSNDEEKPTLL